MDTFSDIAIAIICLSAAVFTVVGLTSVVIILMGDNSRK